MATSLTRPAARELAKLDVEDDGNVSLTIYGGLFSSTVFLTPGEARDMARLLTEHADEGARYQAEQAETVR